MEYSSELLSEDSVDIYSYTDLPFDTSYYADKIFGGFDNAIFYDYFKLFISIIFIIFCIRIFGIFFSK